MRRDELVAQFALVFALPILGVAAGCVAAFVANAPLIATVTMSLSWIAGFAMFFKAKLSVISKANLISFGLRNMSQANRTYYILGYALMGLGLLLAVGIIVFYR